jgi:hypothetical protein
MATRSTIARKVGDTIQSIYCHWDGYPDGVGATLKEHYTTVEKIDALMALGDISVLGAQIGSKKDFEIGVLNDECLAYGRDRGEDGTEAKVHDTYIDFVNYRVDQGCKYSYLWNGTAWEVSELG